MSRFQKLAVSLALTVLLLPLFHIGSAVAAESRHAALVIDANTGAVLHERNADLPRHPASLTKMMTLYLAFEAIEAGRMSYESRVPVSANAAAAAPSKLDLDAGEDIALIDAIKALITKSANDMAIAMAEKIAGSEAAFVRLMNERARQIGMRSSSFSNASGLPDAAQVTTARDMLTLALHLQDDFPRHYRLFSIRSFTYRGKTHRTHNTLMNSFAGIDGIKTGYTRASGFNLVSSLRRDGKHVVAVVFGGVTASARNAHMRALLFHALDDAATERTRRSRPVLVAATRPAQRPAQKAGDAEAPVWKAQVTPEPLQAVAVAAPRPVAAKRPAAPSNTGPASSVSVAAAAPEREIAEPTISIARVRQVQVLPEAGTRNRPEAGKQSMPEAGAEVLPEARANFASAETPADRLSKTPLVGAAATGTFDFRAFRAALHAERQAAPDAAAPAGEMETVLPKDTASIAPLDEETARPAAGLGTELTPLNADAESPVIDTQPAAVATPTSAASGRPASTLAAQARALGQGPAATAPKVQHAAMHLSGPTTAANGTHAIQIGAYASAAEAERRLADAKARAAGVLSGHPALAVAAQSGTRAVYRARFAGFEQQEASTACLELRRQSIDCFVARAD